MTTLLTTVLDPRGAPAARPVPSVTTAPVRAPDPLGEELVALVHGVPREHPDHADTVARAVAHWAPMASRIAGSFRRRTDEPEDLQQVAMAALVQAVLRYRPEVGAFPSYAVPCITGEIRRWLRDFRGLVHVPRRVVELDVEAVRAEERLRHALLREPTAAEVGRELGTDADAVHDARAGRAARTLRALDTPTVHRRDGRADERLAGAEDRAVVTPLLSRLDERSRAVLVLRYYGQRTQQEIATEIGVSQVQVSRILRRSLERMRALATTPPVAEPLAS